VGERFTGRTCHGVAACVLACWHAKAPAQLFWHAISGIVTVVRASAEAVPTWQGNARGGSISTAALRLHSYC